MNDRSDSGPRQGRVAVLRVDRDRVRHFAVCLGFAAVGLVIGAAGALLGA